MHVKEKPRGGKIVWGTDRNASLGVHDYDVTSGLGATYFLAQACSLHTYCALVF
jgi:hypothetical protein